VQCKSEGCHKSLKPGDLLMCTKYVKHSSVYLCIGCIGQSVASELVETDFADLAFEVTAKEAQEAKAALRQRAGAPPIDSVQTPASQSSKPSERRVSVKVRESDDAATGVSLSPAPQKRRREQTPARSRVSASGSQSSDDDDDDDDTVLYPPPQAAISKSDHLALIAVDLHSKGQMTGELMLAMAKWAGQD
jgi:hypothetical protein